jgi:hypothetical protein
MITYAVDVVLLAALVLTSLRVGAMHRELRRLRSYQTQYVQVFGETSRAADAIGGALRAIGTEGRTVLERLEAAIGRGAALSRRLEDMASAADPHGMAAAAPDLAGAGAPDARNEILKFAADSRRLQERRPEPGADAGFSQLRPGREFRLAPGARTAGGNG